MPKKAIFFDIDGTLMHGGRGPFEDDLEAMEEATKRGHLLFLNTGRSYANIQAPLMALSNLYGICAGCGSHILIREEGIYTTMYRRYLSDELLKTLIPWIIQQPKSYILEGEQNCYFLNNVKWVTDQTLVNKVHTFEELKEQGPKDYVTKITIEGPATPEERAFLEPLLNVISYPTYTECIIKGENKARAMELVIEKLGIRQEDTLAVGDSANDIDMVRYAGIGIAVGNASADLKAVADHITAPCGEGGVAQALREFVL